MMAHDKRKLAESIGVSVPELEKIMARISKKGGKTYPISRLLNTKYMPLFWPKRVVGVRGFASRAERGGRGMHKREREILEELRAGKNKGRRRRRLLGVGATAGALGTGAAIGTD